MLCIMLSHATIIAYLCIKVKNSKVNKLNKRFTILICSTYVYSDEL